MTEYAEIRLAELSALHWALKLPSVRDGRGARDRAAHELLHVLALHADFKTGEGAFPSVQSMAEAIGADRSFVRRKLAVLEELGLIRAMDIEEIAELLEDRKAAQGKTAVTDWDSMAGGTQDYYASRFDPEEGGQTAWALAVDDEALWERLAKTEAERQQVAQEKTKTRNKRHNHKRYGTPPPACDGDLGVATCDVPNTVAKGRSVATVSSPSCDGANSVVRRTEHRRATVDSASYDGQNSVVRRRVDPLSPVDPQVTTQATSTDRPATPTPPAAPDGERLHSPRSGESKEPRAWVRGLENAYAASMVSREDLEKILDFEKALMGGVAGRG